MYIFAPFQLVIVFYLHLVSSETLELVHLVFRHGERTPAAITAYPTDPYVNNTFHPFGKGQLTNIGKQTMYKLGKVLRGRYKSLIGEYYIPGLIEAWSTDVPRTKASLMLVLASLFPPKENLIWNNHLNWQPIPFTYLPAGNDYLLSTIFGSHVYDIEFRKHAREEEERILSRHSHLLSYIEKHAGMKIQSLRSVWYLFSRLNTEKEVGLQLPFWAEKVFERLKQLALQEYVLQTLTTQLKRIVAGKFLCKVLKDTHGHLINQTAKMYLYSAHDATIANFLDVLGVFQPHHPNYSSSIALEIYRSIEGIHMKVAYRKSKYHHYEYLFLPNGKQNLRIEEFEELLMKLGIKKYMC